jgi:hypothetical protein
MDRAEVIQWRKAERQRLIAGLALFDEVITAS